MSQESRSGFAALAVLALLAGCSHLDDRLGATARTSLGEVLVDGAGRTLYVHEDDLPGKSQCTEPCTVYWPPAEAGPGARPSGDFTIVTRDSGTRQWAYKGRPLYTFSLDFGPAHTVGDGAADGDWHVARP